MFRNGRREKRCASAQAVPTLGALAILAFIQLSAGAPVRAEGVAASGGSLVDKLHEKQILTDEEYNQLRDRDSRVDGLLKLLDGLSVGTLAYVEFSGGKEKNDHSFNRFALNRGYINVKKTLTPWLRFRVTPDAYQESNGDFKLRLKYLYAEMVPPSVSFLTDMAAEVGIGHMPWLDFEEHINPYRCQGTMFIERAKTFNSADLGVSLRGYFGGQLDQDFQKKVGKYYAGRYGSWHLGIYNGGGYHAAEKNENKIPQVRVTLRPLPGLIPGLQASYFGLFGRGNDKIFGVSPEYHVNLCMLSYQDSWVTLTGQYARTRGDNKGSLVVPGTNTALRGEGYSFFFNTRLPVLDRKLNLFARYDHFDPDTRSWVTGGQDAYDLVNGGLAWEFYSHWLLLAVYEQVMYENNCTGPGAVPKAGSNLEDDLRGQLVLQISF